MALTWAVTAHAQTCEVPAPPEQVSVKTQDAVPASPTARAVPAVVTVAWRSPRTVSQAGMPALYIVEAGSKAGATDVATIQVGAPDTQFTTPVANGTYFVRVRAANQCGPSAPSREERLVVRGSTSPGEPSLLVMLDTVSATRETLGGSAFVRIMGQVRNGWNAGAAALVTVAASYERNGARIGLSQKTYVNGTARRLSRTGVVTDTALEPAATGCFVMFAQFTDTRVTGLEVVAGGGDLPSQPLAGAVDVDGAPTMASDGVDSLRVSGQLRNGGSTVTRQNEVWVEARDSSGRVLDCTGESARTAMAPRRTAPFVVATEAPVATARFVRWWATFDEGADRAEPPAFERYRALRLAVSQMLDADRATVSPQALAATRDALRAELERLERTSSK